MIPEPRIEVNPEAVLRVHHWFVTACALHSTRQIKVGSRRIAADLGIARMTTQRALEVLIANGDLAIVRLGRGSGHPTTYRLVGTLIPRPVTTPTRELYHYTCEHGRVGIAEHGGAVLPLAVHSPNAARRIPAHLEGLIRLVWFTDLATPVPDALGLTRETIYCDRTQYRYRAVDTSHLTAWLDSPLRRTGLAALEYERGSLPRHWWIATVPVPVVLDTADEPPQE